MDLGVLLKGELSRSGQNHYGLFVVYAWMICFLVPFLSYHWGAGGGLDRNSL